MKAAPLLLLLMAAPAYAGENMFSFLFQRRDCDEPRGPVGRWPEVRRAGDLERLCPAQQFAIYERDKMALDAATPSLYRPRYAYATVTTAPAEPSPAPPPPTVPSTTTPR